MSDTKMTMTQKILAHAAGLEKVTPGQLIMAKLDLVMGNDITAPVAMNAFEKAGCKSVFDKDKIALVMDHFVPNKDIKAAQQAKQCREFAGRFDITNFYDVGKMGIEHALIPEAGLCAPGECIIGADSHTCTYGAVGAFSTGVGSTDMCYGMTTGKLWFKVPSALKIELRGRLPKWSAAKDIILHLIGMIGVDGALYRSLEFCGDGVSTLSMEDRLCICNMAIEAGAKNGIFPVDDICRKYIAERTDRKYTEFSADEGAQYDRHIIIELDKIKPTVAFPHLPSNTKTFDEIGDIKIDQCIIGSCTNGRIEDMRAAAEILSGRQVAEGVRCIVIPATQKVYLQMIKEGITEALVNAGCVVSTPTCGPCLGGYMGILAENERCVSTTNRNFVGRMGHTKSEVYLASPYVAAASAVTGRLSCPQDII